MLAPLGAEIKAASVSSIAATRNLAADLLRAEST
jgi:hypothetical protein